MRMNYYEQQLVNEWRKTMSRREAEEHLYEVRRDVNGDPFKQLQPERTRYAYGNKQEAKRERIQEEVDRMAEGKPIDPEHPILRKYIPKEFGTDLRYLNKSEFQTMRAEMASYYGVPEWWFDDSDLTCQETKVPEYKAMLMKPNRKAYELLLHKKTKLDGLAMLLQLEGLDFNRMIFRPGMFVHYAIACQEEALGIKK